MPACREDHSENHAKRQWCNNAWGSPEHGGHAREIQRQGRTGRVAARPPTRQAAGRAHCTVRGAANRLLQRPRLARVETLPPRRPTDGRALNGRGIEPLRAPGAHGDVRPGRARVAATFKAASRRVSSHRAHSGVEGEEVSQWMATPHHSRSPRLEPERRGPTQRLRPPEGGGRVCRRLVSDATRCARLRARPADNRCGGGDACASRAATRDGSTE